MGGIMDAIGGGIAQAAQGVSDVALQEIQSQIMLNKAARLNEIKLQQELSVQDAQRQTQAKAWQDYSDQRKSDVSQTFDTAQGAVTNNADIDDDAKNTAMQAIQENKQRALDSITNPSSQEIAKFGLTTGFMRPDQVAALQSKDEIAAARAQDFREMWLTKERIAERANESRERAAEFRSMFKGMNQMSQTQVLMGINKDIASETSQLNVLQRSLDKLQSNPAAEAQDVSDLKDQIRTHRQNISDFRNQRTALAKSAGISIPDLPDRSASDNPAAPKLDQLFPPKK